MHRRFLALMLVVAAFALVACGGDDEPKDQGSPGTSTTATTPGDGSSANGQDGESKGSKSRSDGERGSRSGSDRERSGGNRESADRRQSRRVRRVLERTRRETRRREQRAKRRARRLVQKAPDRPAPTSTDRTAYNTAKKVCGEFLTAEYIERNDPKEIAKTYATPWPESRRDAAYDGCLAGLKLPRAPLPPDED